MSSSRTDEPGRCDDAPDGRLGRRGHGRRLAGRGRRPDRGRRRRSARSRPTRSTPRCRRRSAASWPRSWSTSTTTVEVGVVLARIAVGDGGARRRRAARRAHRAPVALPARAAPPPRRNATPKIRPAGKGTGGYSPVVQRIAAEHGIDLDTVAGHRPRRPGAQAGRARGRRRQRRTPPQRAAAAHREPVPARAPSRRRVVGRGGCRGCAVRSAST